jgi:hypothetical protein
MQTAKQPLLMEVPATQFRPAPKNDQILATPYHTGQVNRQFHRCSMFHEAIVI